MNVTLAALLGLSLGQPPANDYDAINSRSFKLPIEYKHDRKSIRQVQLYVSRDQGQTWHQEAELPPTQDAFVFTAREDGVYWFNMVIVDLKGRRDPANLTAEPPALKAVIDTTPPQVRFTNARRAGDEVVIEWAVEDRFPDDAATKVFFRPAAAPDGYWQEVTLPPGSRNGVRFPAGTGGPVMVRVLAQDLAKNKNEGVREVAAAGGGTASVSTSLSPAATAPSPPQPAASTAPVPSPAAAASVPPPEPIAPAVPPPAAAPTGPPISPTPTATALAGPTAPPTAAGAVMPPAGPAPAPSFTFQGPAAPTSPTPAAVFQGPASASSGPSPAAPVAGSPAEPGNPVTTAAQSGNPPGGPTAVAVWSGGGSGTPPTVELSRAQVTNQLRFDLAYQVEQQGPSGISRVDLWVTRDDGQTWVRWSQHDGREAAVRVALDHRSNTAPEGLYGFRLVPVSGAGLSEREPARGDAPDIRVVVDTTPPVIEWYDPTSDPAAPDTLAIRWKATDRNFGDDPITLEWAEKPTGPWHPVAATGDNAVVQASAGPGSPRRLANTGRHPWRVPAGLPPRVYVKVTARDAAGNVTEGVTPSPVLIDLAKPRAKISGIVTPPAANR